MSATVPLHSLDEERSLLGPQDAHARAIRNRLGVSLLVHSGRVHIDGEDDAVQEAVEVISDLLDRLRVGRPITAESVERRLEQGPEPSTEPVPEAEAEAESQNEGIEREGLVLPPGVKVRGKGQERYVRTIAKQTVTIAVGPAGTGKTYLAAAVAVAQLRAGQFRKLVLVRPAVEAGEHLGFLPGDIEAKINPYLRPLYDALSAHLEPGRLKHYIDSDVIELAPLAYMRGRTLDQAFVILDEAQNTTKGQMRMFLTRMGRESKVVVTGDETQVDLPADQMSGLHHAELLLGNVAGVSTVRLGNKDIVRHPVVQRIVNAYEQDERDRETRLGLRKR